MREETPSYWATLGSNGLLMPNRHIGFVEPTVEFNDEFVCITLQPKHIECVTFGDCNMSSIRRVSISGDFLKDIFPKGSTGRGYREGLNYRAMRLYFDEDYSGVFHCIIKRNLDNYNAHATSRSKDHDNS